eukprot:TRINITY_DN8731_c0_g1_i1.p1 TRINITY_DN8731_c0_g1~~TRINITY_DN8731_c0_g1_i1.p1  ORF type:complete len:378 (+),score=29.88 TRINITY_DN8731_c0_g1_i1:43-1134(+)
MVLPCCSEKCQRVPIVPMPPLQEFAHRYPPGFWLMSWPGSAPTIPDMQAHTKHKCNAAQSSTTPHNPTGAKIDLKYHATDVQVAEFVALSTAVIRDMLPGIVVNAEFCTYSTSVSRLDNSPKRSRVTKRYFLEDLYRIEEAEDDAKQIFNVMDSGHIHVFVIDATAPHSKAPWERQVSNGKYVGGAIFPERMAGAGDFWAFVLAHEVFRTLGLLHPYDYLAGIINPERMPLDKGDFCNLKNTSLPRRQYDALGDFVIDTPAFRATRHPAETKPCYDQHSLACTDCHGIPWAEITAADACNIMHASIEECIAAAIKPNLTPMQINRIMCFISDGVGVKKPGRPKGLVPIVICVLLASWWLLRRN